MNKICCFKKFKKKYNPSKDGNYRLRNFFLTQLINFFFCFFLTMIFIAAQSGTMAWQFIRNHVGFAFMYYIFGNFILYFIYWFPRKKKELRKVQKKFCFYWLSLFGLIVFIVFLSLYYSYFQPIVLQTFDEAKECEITKAVAQDLNFQETYSALTVKFSDIDGKTQYGYAGASSLDWKDDWFQAQYLRKGDDYEIACADQDKKLPEPIVVFDNTLQRRELEDNIDDDDDSDEEDLEDKESDSSDKCEIEYTFSEIKISSLFSITVDEEVQIDPTQAQDFYNKDSRRCYYNYIGTKSTVDRNSFKTVDVRKIEDFYQVLLEDPYDMLKELLDILIYLGTFIYSTSMVFLFISLSGLLALPLEVRLYDNHVDYKSKKNKNKQIEMQGQYGQQPQQQQQYKEKSDNNPFSSCCFCKEKKKKNKYKQQQQQQQPQYNQQPPPPPPQYNQQPQYQQQVPQQQYNNPPPPQNYQQQQQQPYYPNQQPPPPQYMGQQPQYLNQGMAQQQFYPPAQPQQQQNYNNNYYQQ